jgi:hypothetical protein
VSAGEAEETLSGSYGYQVGSGHIYSSFVLIPTCRKRSEGVIFVTRGTLFSWDDVGSFFLHDLITLASKRVTREREVNSTSNTSYLHHTTYVLLLAA